MHKQIILLRLDFIDMNFLIFLLLLDRLDQGCLIVELQLQFLKLPSELNELGVSVDMGFVSLLIAIDPNFPCVLLRSNLLLKLQDFILHLLALDFKLFLDSFFLNFS